MSVTWAAGGGGAPWHRYEGHYRSLLRLDPSAVAFVGSAIDVTCHEGYPGHHAQLVLRDADSGTSDLAVEDTVLLLRSTDSMLREGAAEYGVELVFPPSARLTFERDVLFPLAGLDASQADRSVQLHRLVTELSSYAVPILRDYRDKHLSAADASRALEAEALVSSPRSLLQFVDELGAYAIGYTVARDNVRNYVETRSMQSGEDKWSILRRILAQTDVGVLQFHEPAGK